MRVMQAYHEVPGCDLVSFAEVVTRDPFMLVGREPRPGLTLHDLPGLHVATVSKVPTPWQCLQEDLRRAGIAPARLTQATDGTMADNVAALRRGELDLVQVFEPFVSELVADGGGHIWHAAADRGPTSYTTFYARKGLLSARRDELRRMVRADPPNAEIRGDRERLCDRGCHRRLFQGRAAGDPGCVMCAIQVARHLGRRSTSAPRRL